MDDTKRARRNGEATLDKPLALPAQRPGARDIRVGRQLFVDDYLIEQTNLTRRLHQARVCPEPVLTPQTALEMNGGFCPCAAPFNDGVFYDDRDGLYKMWYHAGWFDGTSYAQSSDGVRWERLSALAGGDGRLFPYEPNSMRDGCSVWLDHACKSPDERYKMFIFHRLFDREVRYYPDKPHHYHDRPGSVPPREEGALWASGDGIHWQKRCVTPPCGDNTSFFYDPFRKKWVFSLRTFSQLDSRIRTRGYYAAPDFYSARWTQADIRFWQRTDINDLPDDRLGYYTQLYGMDCAPYESLMLGAYSVFLGPPNAVAQRTGEPKLIDVKLGFSRDGFHFTRLGYAPFIASSRAEGRWDYGYIHPANGLCVVLPDTLRFYFGAFSGQSPRLGRHLYGGGATGYAELRRDGFASMEGTGTLLTRPLIARGNALWINADAAHGAIRAEILDEGGAPLPGCALTQCVPFAGRDTTRCRLLLSGGALDGRRVRVRFQTENAALYSFWITGDAAGRSGGYLAAGGPGARDGRDKA